MTAFISAQSLLFFSAKMLAILLFLSKVRRTAFFLKIFLFKFEKVFISETLYRNTKQAEKLKKLVTFPINDESEGNNLKNIFYKYEYENNTI